MNPKALLLVLALALPLCGAARAADPTGEVYGTIVSVRGNILVIRPSLRPKLTRVAVDDHTQVVGSERADVSVLRPGMRVVAGGTYSEVKGFHPAWVEASDVAVGEMAQKFDGLRKDTAHNRAFGGGTLRSVKPFVFTDDAGHEITGTLDHLFGVWHDHKMDRGGLLIGVRVDAQGPQASDGVIQATTISTDRNFAQMGTMFGVVTAVHGDVLDVRPKYATDTIHVRFAPNSILQEQITVDDRRIHIGARVTFWGQPHTGPGAGRPSDTLNALALLVGRERYPAAASGPQGGVFLTGRLVSLDPAVLALPGGKRMTVIIPAQMPIVRLTPATIAALRPGAEAMLVLTRGRDGGFRTSTIVLNASPWVGYGG